mmetsp:Transcript_9424/g.19522  ORF Transcript_9424/g.19522 Transcript_9424/m.19522 type:complete len:116 (-) Transcript_9424:225-572(-)
MVSSLIFFVFFCAVYGGDPSITLPQIAMPSLLHRKSRRMVCHPKATVGVLQRDYRMMGVLYGKRKETGRPVQKEISTLLNDETTNASVGNEMQLRLQSLCTFLYATLAAIPQKKV